jgi:hypothetical protein
VNAQGLTPEFHAALLVLFCVWTVFYLFFSAWVLGMLVSFLLNTLVLQGKSAVHIRAIHFALLRGRNTGAYLHVGSPLFLSYDRVLLILCLNSRDDPCARCDVHYARHLDQNG